MSLKYSEVTAVISYLISDQGVAPEDVFTFKELKLWAEDNGFQEEEE